MDFVDWCGRVLKKIIELSVSPEALGYGFLTDSMLGEALFGEEAASGFIGSTLRSRLHTAIDELGRSGLIVKKRLGQMYKIEVTQIGRARSADLLPLWKEIFAVTLSPDAEQLLRLVNGLSQKLEQDYVWLDAVGRERFHELGSGDKQKRLQAIRELEHHGFVRSFPGQGSELDLTATYRGLIWETRRAPESAAEPEIAHVLFMDIVGYSKQVMDEQFGLRARMKEIVRATETYRRAQARDKVISRSTGDGMALVFFGHPAAPVSCAIEISRALKANDNLRLRMGAHAGPVRRDEDINDQIDVAGGGINFAQRVMDAGDAGHILLSKAVADNLEQMGGWSNYLHDLGEVTVKHGAKVHVYNLHGEDFGNPEMPEKFIQTAPEARIEVEKRLEPNVVCEGEGDLFVELDGGGVFRKTEYYGPGALRADALKFANQPVPGRRVAGVDKVRAQIIFYDFDWPEREAHRVDYGCWLDEESPYVSFDLSDNAIHHLMIGVFQNKRDGGDGFEAQYTIYGGGPVRGVPLSQYVLRHPARYRVKVMLVAGEYGEFSSEHECELEIDPDAGSFSFAHITEAERRGRRESAQRELMKLVSEGEAFVTTPLVNPDWDKLYTEIHEWEAKAAGLTTRLFGRSVSYRLTSTAELKPYPHKIRDGRRRFFDELYTKLENLKEIAREQGAPMPAPDVSKQVREVAEKRRERILTDLAEFAARVAALIEHSEIRRLSQHERDLYVWDADIFDYLSEHLDRADALSICNGDLEEYTPPEDAHVSCHDFLRRAHSRLARLNRLIEEIRSGGRAV